MTEKQMTDEELWEKYATDDEGNLIGTPSFSGRDVAVGKESFMKALSESRKGMFTEEEVKDFGMFMCEPNWKGIDADFEQYLTERKGR